MLIVCVSKYLNELVMENLICIKFKSANRILVVIEAVLYERAASVLFVRWRFKLSLFACTILSEPFIGTFGDWLSALAFKFISLTTVDSSLARTTVTRVKFSPQIWSGPEVIKLFISINREKNHVRPWWVRTKFRLLVFWH